MFQAWNHFIYIKNKLNKFAGLVAVKRHRYLVERLTDNEGLRPVGSVIETEGVCD